MNRSPIRFNTSVFAIEYPGYGPAEGSAAEDSVNDNARTAFKFLVSLGYPEKNIVLMGYSVSVVAKSTYLS